MKQTVGNFVVVNGSFYGAEVEPGTFHLECPVSSSVDLLGTPQDSDDEDIPSAPDDDNPSGCVFLEE